MDHIIYTISALMLLGLLSLSINATRLSSDQTGYETEAVLTGTAIAQSMIDEMVTRRFDENSTPGITDSTLFAYPANLRSDAGEDPSNSQSFDDIDDYNSYRPVVATPTLGNFLVSFCVRYARMIPPYDTLSTGQSFLKRVDVRVFNRYIPNPVDSTISISRYFSYR